MSRAEIRRAKREAEKKPIPASGGTMSRKERRKRFKEEVPRETRMAWRKQTGHGVSRKSAARIKLKKEETE